MPAGRGNCCWDCDWRGRLKKRIEINRNAFAVPAMAAHFDAFGRWLGDEVGVNKAALTINRYVPFFMEIEKRWGHVPDYRALVEHFGTDGLRKVLLPVRWLEATSLTVVDEATKQNARDTRRIAATLARFAEDSREYALLAGYHQLLETRHAAGRTSLRAIKSALIPAGALIAEAASREQLPPDQKTLDAYLGGAPGQLAAVTGFVNYLREHHGAALAVSPIDPRRAESRRREVLERDVARLLERREDGENIESRWLVLALCLLHDVGRQRGRVIARAASIERQEDGFHLSRDGSTYYVPNPPT